jgi:hypothetical protein
MSNIIYNMTNEHDFFLFTSKSIVKLHILRQAYLPVHTWFVFSYLAQHCDGGGGGQFIFS